MDNVKEIPATEHKLVITENGFVKKMKSDVKVVGKSGLQMKVIPRHRRVLFCYQFLIQFHDDSIFLLI